MRHVTAEYSWDLMDRNELTLQEQEDLMLAEEARKLASAPLSGLMVGACLRMYNGECSDGWNFERKASTGWHAEKNAIGRISNAGLSSGLKRVTVVGGLKGAQTERIMVPCGPCRQDLLELGKSGREAFVIMAGVRGQIGKIKLEYLLPLDYNLEHFLSDPKI